MIRDATLTDIPDLLGMVEELRAHVAVPQALDRAHAAGFLAGLVRDGHCQVVDLGAPCGFLAASVGASSISPEPVAMEHGWFCRASGWGGRLRRFYEVWARDHDCGLVRMSSGVGDEKTAAILRRAGYVPTEIAWVKRL